MALSVSNALGFLTRFPLEEEEEEGNAVVEMVIFLFLGILPLSVLFELLIAALLLLLLVGMTATAAGAVLLALLAFAPPPPIASDAISPSKDEVDFIPPPGLVPL